MTNGDGDGAKVLAAPSELVEGPRMRRTLDDAALLRLYDEHQRDLYGFVRAMVREPEAAEDIVAETFSRLMREVRAARAPDDSRGWLFRVATNLVVSAGRRRIVAARFMPRLASRETAEPADARALRRERKAELLSELWRLPVAQRAALVMAAQGFSGREIAAAIGRSEPAVRTLLCRARLDLRGRLAGMERDR